jgi:hypothetical protein
MLTDVPPILVTLGKILFHREAIMLAARSAEARQLRRMAMQRQAWG